MDGSQDNSKEIADRLAGDRLNAVSLADKYNLDTDVVFVNGTQALVRMCLMQSEIDRQHGINSAGYVTGYRGSPLGGIDLQFAQASAPLTDSQIVFTPALNEDLAATAVWGTQQAALHGENTHDGVFAIWYGKGPGVDRTGDVFRHANLAGTDPKGGVLALMGDDHTGESSTVCHQSEYAMMDVMIPVLNPVNLEEMVQFGLHGWAMSRYSGLWVGLKCVKDNIESSSSARLSLEQFSSKLPNDVDLPEGGLNIRRNDHRHSQEERLHKHKIAAAHGYVRANQIDRVIYSGGKKARFGIVATGKAYMDVLQALSDLGISGAQAGKMGLALYKVGMSWPVEPSGLTAFARPLERLFVVEEKRGLMEEQIKSILYNLPARPIILGKKDADGERLLPEEGSIDGVQIALAMIDHLLAGQKIPTDISARAEHLRASQCREFASVGLARTPYFCAGCPHNSSTVLPDGARGYAGIGCHWMAQFMDRSVEGNTHMGGEGANWIGEACFSSRDHVFQNMGDGTFNHSGLMAIRAAVASGVNITYKILYNDAVAMTGGQTHEGDLTPPQIAHLLSASNIGRLALVTDDLSRHNRSDYPAETTFHHRLELQRVQAELAKIAGTTALIYDQTCATEKRRRRKRGLMEDPDKRVIINPEVCEGCGDCGVQSNCVAILPLETALGRKRQIDQSACNKDFSCVNGFCPSFVTVSGGTLAKPEPVGLSSDIAIVEPEQIIPEDKVHSILLTGVGGTGVVTIGALLGMAAHIDKKGCGIIDMAGLAQKGGAVTSHIRIGPNAEDISAIRIGPGGADLMLGCDSLVGAEQYQLKLMNPDGHIIANLNQMPTGEFTRDPDQQFPAEQIISRLSHSVKDGNASFCDATQLALGLIGDAIASNLIMLGVAFQKGLIPLRSEAIEKAIELNNVAVAQSLQAFRWGRLYVADPDRLAQQTQQPVIPAQPLSANAIINDRFDRLVAYQDTEYADSYRAIMQNVQRCDHDKAESLTIAAAKGLYKLMAIKDEYEVARLFTDGTFTQQLSHQFDGDISLRFHLAPPIFSKTDPRTGRPLKREYGSWMAGVMSVLAKMKGLRGSMFDLFGYTAERQRERRWRDRYQNILKELCAGLNDNNYELAVQIADIAQDIRGFGPVREASFARADETLDRLMTQFTAPAKQAQINNA